MAQLTVELGILGLKRLALDNGKQTGWAYGM